MARKLRFFPEKREKKLKGLEELGKAGDGYYEKYTNLV